MTIFAAYAIVAIEGTSLLRLIYIDGMTRQTARRFLRVQIQDAAHAPPDIAGKGREGMRVFVLHHPGAVFILQNAGIISRLNAAVATG